MRLTDRGLSVTVTDAANAGRSTCTDQLSPVAKAAAVRRHDLRAICEIVGLHGRRPASAVQIVSLAGGGRERCRHHA